MKIYNYDLETGCYISEEYAIESPLEPGVFLQPANSTTIKPPEYDDKSEIPIFNGSDWDIVQNKRGYYYDKNDGSIFYNDNLTNEPENGTKETPPIVPEGKCLQWDNGWKLVNDYSGFYYNIITGIQFYHEDKFSLPENGTKVTPPEVPPGNILFWENEWKLIDYKYKNKPSNISFEEWDRTEYERLRANEYPPLVNLADALYWNSRGDSSHLESYFDACEEVKNKYPKPES